MSIYKVCEVCGEEKHISEFSKSYKKRCKKCVAVQTKVKRNDKNTMLRKAINRAETIENELSCAIQKVENLLVFRGFDSDLPNASMCCGGEFILEYQGRELDVDSIIHYMERRGYITPKRF